MLATPVKGDASGAAVLPAGHLPKDPSALDSSTGTSCPARGGMSGNAEGCVPSATGGLSTNRKLMTRFHAHDRVGRL